MASPHLAEQVGRVLDGRYRVVAPIGTGASAAVFLADDTTLRRRVALKVLHAALAGDQSFIKRFQAEAHTAAGLSHPNIMRVLDWGNSEDEPFLVLEYLGGGSLRAVLDQGVTLTPEQTVQIGIQAARALDYAHRRGLVHRDIKPANLLFDEEGRITIADFGLARALAEAAWTEPGGAVLGTARYASPEQVRGLHLDGKADVYSLGLVLMEAVTGQVPFTADTTIATLMARLDAHVTTPEEMGALGPIVVAATHPDPTHRITASELVDMLEGAAKQLPSPGGLTLPGALPKDLTQMNGSDPTMLPGTGEMAQVVSVEARPLPPELTPKRRILRRRPKAAAAGVPLDGRASKRSRVRIPLPSKMQVLATLLIAALIAGAGVGGWTLYYKTGRTLAVPVLDNMTVDAAKLAAANSDIKLSVDEEFSETVPLGMTWGQDPLPGEEVHPREPVHVKASKGPAPREVPNVVGQQQNDARAALNDKGFNVKTENKFDEVEPKDKVLGQNPNSGTFDKGTEITLVVSGGPQPRIVPSVQGKSQAEAVAAIEAQGLKVNIQQGFSDTVPVGQVAGTTPAAGASVPRGGTVTLVISKGPELVAIPSVSGSGVTAATAKLQGAGFAVNNVYGPPNGTVFDTNPTVGTKVKKGANVALYTR